MAGSASWASRRPPTDIPSGGLTPLTPLRRRRARGHRRLGGAHGRGGRRRRCRPGGIARAAGTCAALGLGHQAGDGMRGPGGGASRRAGARRACRAARLDRPPPAGPRGWVRLRRWCPGGTRADADLLERGVRHAGRGARGRGTAAVRGAAGSVGAGAARDERDAAGGAAVRRPRRAGRGPCGARARAAGTRDPAGRADRRGGDRRVPRAAGRAAGVRAPGSKRLGAGLRGPRPEVAALDRGTATHRPRSGTSGGAGRSSGPTRSPGWRWRA